MKPFLLESSKYKGYKVFVSYNTFENYLIVSNSSNKEYSFTLVKQNLVQGLEKTFWMELYPDYFPEAKAYGFFEGSELIAFIELTPEHWNKRMRITEIWVEPRFRRRNIASDLLLFAIDLAKKENARMMILETQSCNIAAINLYLKNGFSLVGFDLFCYSNEDIENHEIRLELGMILGEAK